MKLLLIMFVFTVLLWVLAVGATDLVMQIWQLHLLHRGELPLYVGQ